MASPRPGLSVRLAARLDRPKRVSTSSRSPVSMPMPSSRTHSRSSSPSSRLPSPTRDPGAEYFTAFEANCSQAWTMRPGSSRTSTSANSSIRQSRSPSIRALSKASSVRRTTSTGSGTTKSSRSDVAKVSRSSTRRDIRSSSSSVRARVADTSPGSAGFIIDRWPRTTVSGVRNSWPTSSSSRRCPACARSSRSSMPFTVRVRAERSSSPRTGIRRLRSSSPICSAVLRTQVSGCRRYVVMRVIAAPTSSTDPMTVSQNVRKIWSRWPNSTRRSTTRTRAPVVPEAANRTGATRYANSRSEPAYRPRLIRPALVRSSAWATKAGSVSGRTGTPSAPSQRTRPSAMPSTPSAAVRDRPSR